MPQTDEQVFIAVEGRKLDLAAAKIIRVNIEQALLLPDAFSIVLAEGLDWLQDDTFGLGKEVKIELAQGTSTRKTLIKGEVTGLMPTMTSDNEVELQIRGYDKSHRLQRGRQTRSFVQVTDSDIAERIALELGLGTNTKPTTEVHDYVLHHNQTNLEFLQQRAAAIGYQVGVHEGDLYFKPVGEPISNGVGGPPVALKWGENLEEFEISRSTPGQATEVVVRGWDPKKKEVVVGQSKRSDAGPDTKRNQAGGAAVKSAFGMDAPMTVLRPDITTQATAEKLAQAICDEMHGDFTTAHGSAVGDPDLRPGANVKVSGVGVFDGTYRVSSASHVFDQRGYSTSFSIEGARAPFSPLLGFEPPQRSSHAPWFSIGIVTNNKDPEEMGRVKVKLPFLADELESDWCRLLSPMAGDGRGFYFMPELDDEVVVAFAGGPGNLPIVIGSLWGGKDATPVKASQAVSDGKVVQRLIKTRAGNLIELNDTSGKEKVVIHDKNGNQISLECEGNKITISSKGEVEIHSAGKMTVRSDADMDVRASGRLNLRGSTVNIN
jgi:phage protein D/phage baseplate assembly protein gpV